MEKLKAKCEELEAQIEEGKMSTKESDEARKTEIGTVKESLAGKEKETNSLNKKIDEQTSVISGLEGELMEAADAKELQTEQLETKESLVTNVNEAMKTVQKAHQAQIQEL